MAKLNAANNAKTLLSGDIDAVATSFYVVDASVFPAPPFVITIDEEILQVNTVLGNVLSDVIRGSEGTTAAAHSNGTDVENRWTAGMYDGLVGYDDINTFTQDINDLAGVGRTTETVKGNADDLDAHSADTATQAALGHVKLPETFKTATLQNGWEGGLGYKRDAFGNLYLSGYPSNGTNVAGTVVTTLPVGYRPDIELIWSIGATAGNTLTAVQLRLNTSGEISIRLATNATQLFFNNTVLNLLA